MKRFLAFLIIIFISASTFTGCDFKDIDKRLFIVAIGIDSDKEDPSALLLTLKAAIPTSGTTGGGGNATSELYKISGTSLADIFREIKTQTTFEPDFSQMKMLIFGKDFAEKNSLVSIVDFFVRRRDFQNILYITVGEPSAQKILALTPTDEKFTGNALFMKYGQGTDSPYSDKLRLFEMYRDMLTPGLTPSCSVLEIKDDKLKMEKVAIFSNGKLALELNGDESKILNLLKRKIRFSSISIAEKENTQPSGLGINKGYSKIKVSDSSEGTVVCHIDTYIDGSLEETSTESQTSEKLKSKFGAILEKRISSLLDKFKQFNVDPLQLQVEYWASNSSYEFSQSWLKDTLPNIKYDIIPHITIYSTGSIKVSKE
jgi:spore germination protein KC